jgi:hypothetical protein
MDRHRQIHRQTDKDGYRDRQQGDLINFLVFVGFEVFTAVVTKSIIFCIFSKQGN